MVLATRFPLAEEAARALAEGRVCEAGAEPGEQHRVAERKRVLHWQIKAGERMLREASQVAPRAGASIGCALAEALSTEGKPVAGRTWWRK